MEATTGVAAAATTMPRFLKAIFSELPVEEFGLGFHLASGFGIRLPHSAHFIVFGSAPFLRPSVNVSATLTPPASLDSTNSSHWPRAR